MTNITLEERKQILQDAIRFKKTDRIPTCSNYWTYIVLHENLKLSEAFYDYDVLLNALSSFHEQYEFDTYAYSGDRNPFLVTETLDGNLYIVNDETGHINCGDNVLMDPSEYSELIANPQKFIWEKAIPRKCKALNNPDAPERVKDTVREYKKFSDFNAAYDQKFVNEYHVPRRAAGFLIFGFDYLFNYLRGIKGTSIDLRRRYDQVMDAIEAIENMLGVPNYLASMDAPIDDGYVFGTTVGLLGHSILSPKQFGRIYHPNMKKVCDKNAELGRLVNIFSEATFARFYEYFEDIPKGVACALVEQDDLFEMRKRLPNIAICGGMPTALLGGGTKEECIDYGKKLIDGLACDGGFLMSQDKMMSYRNDAKPENIMAIQELCRTYTG